MKDKNLSTYINSFLRMDAFTGLGNSNIQEILKDSLKKSSLEDIKFQFNLLSQAKLWTEALIDVFYDALLDKLISLASFVFYVSLSETGYSLLIHIGDASNYQIPNIFQRNSDFYGDLAGEIVTDILSSEGKIEAEIKISDEIKIFSINNIKLEKIDEEGVVSLPLEVSLDPDISLLSEMINRLRKNILSPI